MIWATFSWLPDWVAKFIAVGLGLMAVFRFLVVYFTAREMRKNLDLLKSYAEQCRAPVTVDTAWLQSLAEITARQLLEQYLPEPEINSDLEKHLRTWIYRGLLNGASQYGQQHHYSPDESTSHT